MATSRLEPANIELLKKYGFNDPHPVEVAKEQILLTNWPTPSNAYRSTVESWNESVEETYFWLLGYLRNVFSYPIIHKVTDLFSASEHSSFFGVAQQRIGLQQDKVSNYLAVIGKMTKELFQLVRELRIIDERLSFYEGSMKRDKNIWAVKDQKKSSKQWESAEVTLKGYWVDLVEQGSKNPSSVYGMAREVQFTTLPDLFFSIHPYDETMVDDIVETEDLKNAFNRKVREVLKRKLRTYLAWKKQTRKELISKRGFTLRYMFQHVHVIRLYMSYVKPYLKNVVRLQVDEQMRHSPDMIAAFEGSMVEVELLAQALPAGNKKVWNCISLHLMYRTKPSMNYNAEGYNRGPIHEGEININFRSYEWTQEQIDNYVKMRDREEFELLKVIDKNLEFVMEELGEDLFKYLNEAETLMVTKYKDSGYVPFDQAVGLEGKVKAKQENEKIEPAKADNPFVSVVKGFGEVGNALNVFSTFSGSKKKNTKKAGKEEISRSEFSSAQGASVGSLWLLYKAYKKSHRLIAW